MSLVYLFYMLVTAIVLAFVFAFIFRSRGPWGNMWLFAAIIFLGTWAISLWIEPFGPVWLDVYWLPPLAIGLVLAVMLAAAVPSPRARAKLEKDLEESGSARSAPLVLGTFFWILLLLLMAVIIVGML